MRTLLLASAAVFGAALAMPVLAQDHAAPAPASTASSSGKHGVIVPPLPVPSLGPEATPGQYLQAAQQEVTRHHAGAAQEALERAETRLLDRATAPSRADQPDNAPAIQDISQAIAAVRKHDWQAASQHIDAATRQVQMARSGDTGTMVPASGVVPSATPANPAGAAAGTTGAAAPTEAAETAWNPSYDSHYPPYSAGEAPAAGTAMTAGTSSVPMGGVLPPNGGVMPPNGGVMQPNVP
jgi:hypothetical protein